MQILISDQNFGDDARLAGKRCLVTGGGSGIGRAVALPFAAEGAAVVVTGRRAEKLEETAARAGNITIQAGDAGNADDARAMVEAVVSRHGGLDVLFHGAGVLRRERDRHGVRRSRLRGHARPSRRRACPCAASARRRT